MSYFPTIKVETSNSPSIDAFARLRISNPLTLFDYSAQYDDGSLFWDKKTVGSGTTSHLPNESSVQLTTGSGTSGHSCIRQTFEYFRYEPGKSQLIIMTGVMGALKTNVRQRIGYFDGYNGVFFEQDGVNLKIVNRTNISGTPVDGYVIQANWNADKLDGYGPSGVTLDTSKANIFWFDIEWLGAGRVRAGIWGPDGIPIVCHEFRNANALTSVYMTTPNLPLRYEITNTGAASGATTMKQICSTVISEGGAEYERAYSFSAPNAKTGTGPTISTRRAILTIRPKPTLNSITTRIKIIPTIFTLSIGSANIYWELVYNPIFTGTPSWSSPDGLSGVEYSTHGDAANGAISSGTVIDSGFAISGTGLVRSNLANEINIKFPISLDMDGLNPKSLSLVCTALSGSPTALGSFTWKEIR